MVWSFLSARAVSKFPWLHLVVSKTFSMGPILTAMSRCASQPLAGKTFVLFPKKLIYLIYLAIFEIGSLVCALAPSSQALIVGRAVAGLGASGMFAGGFAVQATIIPLHKRAIWIGAISSTFVVASIVGPVIGGALTQVRCTIPWTPALDAHVI